MHGSIRRASPLSRVRVTRVLALFAVTFLLLGPATTHAAFCGSQKKAELRAKVRETWYHAYDSYKKYAFPADELLPLSCKGQGHDRQNPDNAAVNDVMGDYVLTVVDSLDTFPMLKDKDGFEQAVRDAIEHVSFDVDSRVQVFEVTIRMMGGLLSGHLLATPPESGNFSSSIRGYSLPWYRGELLDLARDLGRRLLPAFETPTGMPFARINLRHGLRGKGGKAESGETCSAGAGSLLLEFITLSRLTGDPVFEQAARRAFFAVWHRKSDIGLIGNTIDVRTGMWLHGVAGIGAGIDSFYEYAAKAYILTGEDDYLRVWEEGYAALQRYVRTQDGFWFRGVNMMTGQLSATTVDSLSAFMPGVLALMGDLDTATKLHAPFAFLWARYSGLPELYETHRRSGAHYGFPLRPEFIESNMYLYQATRDDWYLEVAERALDDINRRTRVDCGFAAMLNLGTGKLEEKMPSFVTAETLKYLYLTFVEDSPFLRDDGAFVFSTEGHPLEIPRRPSPPSPSKRTKLARTFATSDVGNATENAISGLARSCSAHEPLFDERYSHFLSLGMDRRIDWEHARWLAGHMSQDESDWITSGRWSPYGWCQVAETENYGIELLFAAAGGEEIVSPEPSQVSPHPSGNGDVVIHAVTGLRLLLSPMPYGSDGYLVSRIGPINVPSGAHVVIRDQAVVSTVPAIQPVTKIRLEARSDPIVAEDALATSTETRQDNEPRYPAQLDIPTLAASFGPSLAHRPPEAIPPGSVPFMIDGQPLPLRLPRFDILGCEPPSLPSTADGKPEPHLLLLHRGQCSFALKSHHAALAGAKGVIVVSHPTSTDDEEGHNLGGFVVPGAEATEEADETMEALVPLVLVANSTGQALEGMVRRAQGLAVDDVAAADVATGPTDTDQIVLAGGSGPPKQGVMVRLVAEPEPSEPDEEEEHVDGLILGGYVVRNIKLHRMRNASPPPP